MTKYIILALAILLSAVILGGSYIAVEYNKQQSIEEQKRLELEYARQEQLDLEAKEQQAKEEIQQGLETCLSNANESYNNQWYEECKALGKLTRKCTELEKMTIDEYAKENNIQSKIIAEFDYQWKYN